MTEVKKSKWAWASGGQHKGPDKWILDQAGNRTVLTPTVVESLLNETRKGRWPQMAAVRSGVDPRTLAKWLERGVGDDAIEPYKSFAQAFLLAEAEFVVEMEDVLINNAKGELDYQPGKPRPNPETARYLLERRMGILWGGKAMSGLEVVARSEGRRAVRQKAIEFLDSLSEADKARARSRGIMLPDRPVQLTEGKGEDK